MKITPINAVSFEGQKSTRTRVKAKPKTPRVADRVYYTCCGIFTTFQPKPMRFVRRGNMLIII